MPRNFRWDRASARYRGPSGRFVSSTQVRLWLDEALATAGGRVDALAAALRARTLDPISWEVAMRREIKLVALYSAAAAKGGWAQMSEADFGRVGQYVRGQYEYLRRFAQDVVTGTQPLDGRVNARAQLYSQSGRILYHRFEVVEQKVRGMTEKRNVRYAGDSCDGCMDASAAGWHSITGGGVSEIGSRDCRTRCRCRWEYR